MSIFGGGATPPTDTTAIMEAAAKAQLSKHIGRNLGPFILGWTFDFMLFGVLVHQVILWSSNFKGERLFIKIIVLWITLISVITTAYGIYYVWTSFVVNFGLFFQFAQTKKLSYHGLLDVATIFPVQLFYLERAYRLNHEQKWILIVILPILITSFVGGIGSFVVTNMLHSVLELKKMQKWWFVWLGTTAGADILLTGLIIYGLYKSRTGWTETDRLINRLIRTSFESQLPSTIFEVAFLIYFGIETASLINAFFQLTLTKIYAVSLMAVLNYRFTLRKNFDTSNLETHQRRSNTFNLSHRHHQDTLHTDKIHVDTIVYSDSNPSPDAHSGANRHRMPDEESGHTSLSVKDHFSSSTRLHQ